MAKKEYRLKGHESFTPRIGWISKGLKEVNDNPTLFSQSNFYGADDLGVGVNMAKSIRYWLTAMGLATVEREAHLTELGKIIYDNDSYIEELFTLWILHYNLVNNRREASSWYVFFKYGMDAALIREEWKKLLYAQTIKEFDDPEINAKTSGDDSDAILQMYTRSWVNDDPIYGNAEYDPEDKSICPFVSLGLITKNEKKHEITQPETEDFPELAMMYALVKVLSGINKESISIDELYQGEGGIKQGFSLSRIQTEDILNKLVQRRYIRFDRTAGLDTIYLNKKISIAEVMNEYYR